MLLLLRFAAFLISILCFVSADKVYRDPLCYLLSSPTEIEHSEWLTPSLLNELPSFEMLAVINFNLFSHKLLNLNNYWSCFKSFENIISEFQSCSIPISWKWKQNLFKYNKMRWGGNYKRGTEYLQLYAVQVSNSLQFCDIEKSSVRWKKRLLVIDLFQICLFFVTCYQATVKPHKIPWRIVFPLWFYCGHHVVFNTTLWHYN